MTDLLPPVPPGAQRKTSIFKKLFSKKQKPAEATAKSQTYPIAGSNEELNKFSQDSSATSFIPAPPGASGSTGSLYVGDSNSIETEPDSDFSNLRQNLGLASDEFENKQHQGLIKSNIGSIEDIELSEPALDSKASGNLMKGNAGHEAGIQKLLDELKPNYSPSKLPEIPILKADSRAYNTIDFTKDPMELARGNKSKDSQTLPIQGKDREELTNYIRKAQTSLPENHVENLGKSSLTKGAGLDWTSELLHATRPSGSIRDKIAAPPEIDASQDELIQELEKQVMQDPVSNLPLSAIQEENPVSEGKSSTEHKELELVDNHRQLEPSTQTVKDEAGSDESFLSQPVQKFAEQVRQRISQQVRLEEKEKLLAELKDKQDKDNKQRIEEEKRLAEENKRMKFNAEQELKKALAEKVKAEKFIEDEKAKISSEKKELAENKAAFETQRKSLEDQEARIVANRQSMDFEKSQLESDKTEAQDLLLKLANMRDEFKSLQRQIELMNEKIRLNEKLREQLEKREAAIGEAQEKLSFLEKNIREKGFSNYLAEELTAQEIKYPGMHSIPPEPPEDDAQVEAYKLIDQCRGFVWQNMIREAKASYMLAREKYHELLSNGKDDDKLYTAIRELYDDINLALMK